MSKPRSVKKKRKTAKAPMSSLLIVPLPLIGIGLILLIVSLFLRGAGREIMLVVGVLTLGGGIWLTVKQFLAPHLNRQLVFGNDAVRVVRGMNKTVIGEIPYSNMATVELIDRIIMGENDHGERYEIERERVVGITVFRRDDSDTSWPYKADPENPFDYYIDNSLKVQLSSVVQELDTRIHRAREQKLRKMHDREDRAGHSG